MKRFLTSLFTMLSLISFAQTVTVLTTKAGVSLRGLSVVTDSIIWASGSKGTVAHSTDGGKTFEWLTVTGYEGRDFRDVEAFDNNTAIIMAVAEPGIILKTTDGGKNWKKVFEDTTKGMFLDAMDFNGKNGIVVGDPIKGRMFSAFTTDFGDSWTKFKYGVRLDTGEAFFASSGTNVKLLPVKGNLFRHAAVSGGTQSHFIGSAKTKLALQQGKESQGANSIAVDAQTKRIVIVGGDFASDNDTTANCVFSTNFGATWQKPHTLPHGYRSCVAFITPQTLIACGTSGIDISEDGGNNWKLLSGESFHVCQKAKKGTAVFLAGKDGRIGKLVK